MSFLFLLLFSFFIKEELVNTMREQTVNASIASRPCGFDPLSQCYNGSIEGILEHTLFTEFTQHTFLSAGFYPITATVDGERR